MDTWLNSIKTGLSNVGGIAQLEDLYPEVQRIRGGVPSPTWRTTIRRTILDHSSDSQGFRGSDLFYSVKGLGSGVWGLRSSLKPTPIAVDLSEPKTPERVLTQIYRILRDTDLTRKLKALYKGSCQVCGETLRLANGELYSEAHHIQPLGHPHNGPDTAENIVVLCPNHHVLLDYGALRLDRTKLLTVRGHSIAQRYVRYHDEVIFTDTAQVRSNFSSSGRVASSAGRRRSTLR